MSATQTEIDKAYNDWMEIHRHEQFIMPLYWSNAFKAGEKHAEFVSHNNYGLWLNLVNKLGMVLGHAPLSGAVWSSVTMNDYIGQVKDEFVHIARVHAQRETELINDIGVADGHSRYLQDKLEAAEADIIAYKALIEVADKRLLDEQIKNDSLSSDLELASEHIAGIEQKLSVTTKRADDNWLAHANTRKNTHDTLTAIGRVIEDADQKLAGPGVKWT